MWRPPLPARPAYSCEGVLDLLAAGAERAEILTDHPLLEPEDITAALEYAAQQTDHSVLRVA